MAPDAIELSFGDYVIRKSDLGILMSRNEWLNDTIIGFYFQYLEENMSSGRSEKLHFIGPEVTQLMKLLPPEDIPSVCGTVIDNLKESGYCFFPVNDSDDTNNAGGSHWSLLIYSKLDKAFVHLDSMDSNENVAKSIFKKLKCYLGEVNFIDVPCIKQSNSYDCGCHVLRTAEMIANFVLQADTKISLLGKNCPSSNNDEASAMRQTILKLVEELKSKNNS